MSFESGPRSSSQEPMPEKSVTILVTAAIDVDGAPFVEFADPRLRLAQYKDALGDCHRQCPELSIVLCENTGYEIGALRDLASPDARIEILQWQLDPAMRQRGKGYCELATILEAVEKSETLKRARLVLKITGRYLASLPVRQSL